MASVSRSEKVTTWFITINLNVRDDVPDADAVKQAFLAATSRIFRFSNLRSILKFGVKRSGYANDRFKSNDELGLRPSRFSSVGCLEVGGVTRRIHMHLIVRLGILL